MIIQKVFKTNCLLNSDIDGSSKLLNFQRNNYYYLKAPKTCRVTEYKFVADKNRIMFQTTPEPVVRQVRVRKFAITKHLISYR